MYDPVRRQPPALQPGCKNFPLYLPPETDIVSDMTKIISLNESALYLWNALAGKEFSVDDAARLLTERYEVDDATAARDAAAWVEKLRDCKLI